MTSLLVLASLIFAFAAFLPARADELEKILSPEYIKEFRVMKRVGNALYGIRLNAGLGQDNGAAQGNLGSSQELSGTSTDKVSPGALVNKAKKILEKIPAPAFIHLYEKIQEKGNALWGIRKDDNGQDNNNDNEEENMPGRASSTSAIVSGDAVACVTAAINTKDQALVAKLATTMTDLQAAINTRSTCQQAAIQTTSNQHDALDACINTFQDTHDQIAKTAKLAQESIWKTYKDSLKSCRPALSATSTPQTDSSSSMSGEIMINDGSENVMDTATSN